MEIESLLVALFFSPKMNNIPFLLKKNKRTMTTILIVIVKKIIKTQLQKIRKRKDVEIYEKRKIRK